MDKAFRSYKTAARHREAVFPPKRSPPLSRRLPRRRCVLLARVPERVVT